MTTNAHYAPTDPDGLRDTDRDDIVGSPPDSKEDDTIPSGPPSSTSMISEPPSAESLMPPNPPKIRS